MNIEYGCYEFIAYDSAGDGMYNWPSNAGNGYIKFYDITGKMLQSLEPWFGEEIHFQFIYSDFLKQQ